MVKNADKIGGGTTAFHDSRITKVGNFLRKTKLDEIPQLGQVFLGKMSLIGPRPELLKYVKQYKGEEKDILQVRPGITDYSSIEFINLDEIVGGEANADEMYEQRVLPEKNKLRVKYAHTVSLSTDIKLLFLTIWKVIDVNNGELVPSARSNCTTLPKQEYRLAGWLYRSATALCQRCEPLFR